MRKIARIPHANTFPDPNNPRTVFEECKIAALASDMKIRGQLIPVIVWEKDGKYYLIDGEMRWRAAKFAGISELIAIVLSEIPSTAELRILQHSLDAHREQLTPMERSNLVAEIQKETGWSVGELVEQLSLDQSVISKAIAYQRLAPEIQAMLQAGTIRTEQAYLISQTSDFAEQLQLLKSSEGLSRDQFRAKAQRQRPGEDEGQAGDVHAARRHEHHRERERIDVGASDRRVDGRCSRSFAGDFRRVSTSCTAQRVLKDKAKVKT